MLQMRLKTYDELHDPSPLSAHGDDVCFDMLHSRMTFLDETFALRVNYIISKSHLHIAALVVIIFAQCYLEFGRFVPPALAQLTPP